MYEEGLQRFPNDTVILDGYTDLLISLDQQDKAKPLIERSIQMNPKQEGRKYFIIAEMLTGNERLQMFKEGIQVLQMDFERYGKAGRDEDQSLVTR